MKSSSPSSCHPPKDSVSFSFFFYWSSNFSGFHYQSASFTEKEADGSKKAKCCEKNIEEDEEEEATTMHFNEISVDATIAAFLSKPGSIFTLIEDQKTALMAFLPHWTPQFGFVLEFW